MKKYPTYIILIAVIIGLSLTAFDDEAIEDKKVKAKYDELVAAFFAKEDKACRFAALEEAKLTWAASSDGGEEEEDSGEPRLSKPEERE